jgi:putative endonuclease
MARRHLEEQGYRIIEKNYRCRIGEIDLIASHEEALVFIEVKTRNSARYGSPRQAITAAKQKKLSIVALSWLKKMRKMGARARFDVVLIDTSGPFPRIETIRNAFPLAHE